MVFKKSFFKIGMWHSRPPRDPPAFMANTILNFHFDYRHTSLSASVSQISSSFLPWIKNLLLPDQPNQTSVILVRLLLGYKQLSPSVNSAGSRSWSSLSCFLANIGSEQSVQWDKWVRGEVTDNLVHHKTQYGSLERLQLDLAP